MCRRPSRREVLRLAARTSLALGAGALACGGGGAGAGGGAASGDSGAGAGGAASGGGDAASGGGDARASNPTGEMSFFVTSEGSPDGGNLGGLAGADAWCQRLAAAAGAGRRTWRAYLSTSVQVGNSFKPEVNARDRIGKGPWFNQQKQMIASDVASLHANGIAPALILDEKGMRVPSRTGGVMVGTKRDGTGYPLRNCYGWTSNRAGVDGTNDFARLGHAAGKTAAEWVDSQGADCNPDHQRNLSSCIGRIYCFAAD